MYILDSICKKYKIILELKKCVSIFGRGGTWVLPRIFFGYRFSQADVRLIFGYRVLPGAQKLSSVTTQNQGHSTIIC